MEQNLWHQAELISDGNPSIYAIKCNSENVVRHDSKIRKCDIGTKNTGSLTEKVILFVGETGTGKTTMINRIVNYLLGVQWDDKERYKLIGDEEEEAGGDTSQTESKTKWISAYTFHQTKPVNCKVTLIDTPGFGDTGGKERDKFITSQMQDFFGTNGEGGIDHIDAVSFVLQASARRLTETQRYIFDSVLHLFGKDISNNIFLFITHAETENMEDGNAPVIDAVKKAKIPYANFNIFNNAALFRDKSKMSGRRAASSSSRYKEMWDLGEEDLEGFFKQLDLYEPRSILLSAEVLKERTSIEMAVKGLPARIKTCLVEINNLEKEREVLEKYKHKMDKNQDFSYTVDEEVKIETNLSDGENATICTKCMHTCHYPCRARDGNPSVCTAFGPRSRLLYLVHRFVFHPGHWDDSEEGVRQCFVCPGHCKDTDHQFVPYIFEPKIVRVTKTKEDMKQRFDLAKQGKNKAEDAVTKVEEQLKIANESLENCLEMLRNCLKRLDEIALKSDSLPVLNHLQSIIQTERLKGESGWEDRVKELERLCERERDREASQESDSR